MLVFREKEKKTLEEGQENIRKEQWEMRERERRETEGVRQRG